MRKSNQFKKIMTGGLLAAMMVSASSMTALAATNISVEKAKSIALEDASVTEKDAVFVKNKKAMDDGVAYYDIEFIAGETEYEYEIKMSTGKILEKSSEAVKTHKKKAVKSKDSKYIGIDAAKKVALNHAELSDKVTFIKAKLTKDDGVYLYDIEFYQDGIEYEYEINAKSGKVIEFNTDEDTDEDMDED